MLYVVATALVLLNTVWFVLVLLRLPGIWLMALSTGLVAWWRWDEGMFNVWTLVAVLVLAFLSEVLEFVAGAAGTKKMGGSARGAVAAMAGGVVGALAGTVLVPVPVFGSLIGAIGGAALGAWAVELMSGRRMHEAVRSGAGAGIGTMAGAVIKLGFGVAVWLVIAVAAFWP